MIIGWPSVGQYKQAEINSASVRSGVDAGTRPRVDPLSVFMSHQVTPLADAAIRRAHVTINVLLTRARTACCCIASRARSKVFDGRSQSTGKK